MNVLEKILEEIKEKCEEVSGKHWTGKRDKGQEIPKEMKTRWSRVLNN